MSYLEKLYERYKENNTHTTPEPNQSSTEGVSPRSGGPLQVAKLNAKF